MGTKASEMFAEAGIQVHHKDLSIKDSLKSKTPDESGAEVANDAGDKQDRSARSN